MTSPHFHTDHVPARSTGCLCAWACIHLANTRCNNSDNSYATKDKIKTLCGSCWSKEIVNVLSICSVSRTFPTPGDVPERLTLLAMSTIMCGLKGRVSYSMGSTCKNRPEYSRGGEQQQSPCRAQQNDSSLWCKNHITTVCLSGLESAGILDAGCSTAGQACRAAGG